ncbi:Pentatricopeptide repeat-containing protein [Camellia lanceoleosa]|uniref:Pentatricopeptide repeat-containing protein n=1 Tax=Camellia lanceoleosa TaxID=1840588 RepID=A0ACC0HDG3_9ERIC|nr:Pentatricopeptide repeat-containing protein [Camellia lanceoleosa]
MLVSSYFCIAWSRTTSLRLDSLRPKEPSMYLYMFLGVPLCVWRGGGRGASELRIEQKLIIIQVDDESRGCLMEIIERNRLRSYTIKIDLGGVSWAIQALQQTLSKPAERWEVNRQWRFSCDFSAGENEGEESQGTAPTRGKLEMRRQLGDLIEIREVDEGHFEIHEVLQNLEEYRSSESSKSKSKVEISEDEQADNEWDLNSFFNADCTTEGEDIEKVYESLNQVNPFFNQDLTFSSSHNGVQAIPDSSFSGEGARGGVSLLYLSNSFCLVHEVSSIDTVVQGVTFEIPTATMNEFIIVSKSLHSIISQGQVNGNQGGVLGNHFDKGDQVFSEGKEKTEGWLKELTSTEEYAKRNYANNDSEYNTVIASLTSQRRHYLLGDVYDDMMLDGVKPERDTFHSPIAGAMKGARLQDAFFFRDEMKAMGLVPDVMETLLEMLRRDNQTPDVFILMQVMRCYLHSGDIERGQKIFEEYMKSGKQAMVELYVTLAEGAMVGYTPKGMQLAFETLENRTSRDFFLSPKMGNDLLLVAAGEKTGGYTMANYVWDLMQARKIMPSLPAVEAYYNGLKERDIPEDDQQMIIVTRTYNNLRQKIGPGPGRGQS